MQLNYDRLDHHHLYRGGEYIVEDGNMLKPLATHFPPGYHYSYHRLIPPSKSQNMTNILISTTTTAGNVVL